MTAMLKQTALAAIALALLAATAPALAAKPRPSGFEPALRGALADCKGF